VGAANAIAEYGIPFFTSLPSANANDHLFGMDIADTQLTGFPDPQAAAITGHEQGTIHRTAEGRQQSGYLGRRQNGG
jgi:hypothetical protein